MLTVNGCMHDDHNIELVASALLACICAWRIFCELEGSIIATIDIEGRNPVSRPTWEPAEMNESRPHELQETLLINGVR